LLVAGGLVGLFVLAWWIDPYDATGQARLLETHTQLGLAPCEFRRATGQPCPACGLTSSVALLAHGDVVNSLRANAVGTLLAVFWLVLIPWAVVSFVRRRTVGVRSLERALTWAVAVFLGLLLLRWGLVLALS